jgi:hypothetical protein
MGIFDTHQLFSLQFDIHALKLTQGAAKQEEQQEKTVRQSKLLLHRNVQFPFEETVAVTLGLAMNLASPPHLFHVRLVAEKQVEHLVNDIEALEIPLRGPNPLGPWFP